MRYQRKLVSYTELLLKSEGIFSVLKDYTEISRKTDYFAKKKQEKWEKIWDTLYNKNLTLDPRVIFALDRFYFFVGTLRFIFINS